MNKVIIETKLAQADFIKVNYILLFQKMSTKILLLVVLLMIVLPAFLALKGHSFNWQESFIGIGLACFYILSTWFTAKRNFRATAAISEPLTYTFTDDQLICTGNLSSSQTTWKNIYKVSETKDCLLIWKSREIVNVLPKRAISMQQRTAIKEMLQRNKVRNSLK